ncbi:MAG TPA: segregation/condensation protein A [Candidatus Tyrphobacter sp.]|nr:segregation/condensation protein A [Candidatus Tyrphobacter sp.]
MYELAVSGFSGPMEKLLELIEAKKLEITALNLAEVTGDFLAYLEKLEKTEPDFLADFIQVAARLILIKSLSLLPSLKLEPEEKAGIADLENRLKIYRELKGSEANLKKIWGPERSFFRPFLSSLPKGFYFSGRIELAELERAVERLFEGLASFSVELEKAEVKLVNLEEEITNLVNRVSRVIKTSFSELKGGEDRSKAVVLFLALLHLLKDNLVKVRQEEIFSEIFIEKAA